MGRAWDVARLPRPAPAGSSGAGTPLPRATLVRVDGCSVSYPTPGGGRVPALRDLSLEVRRGEWLAIIGHNGSGKSTLAKLFNGLVIPGRGTVTVDGLSTRDPAEPRSTRQIVGMVFQNFYHQLVATTV